MDECLTDQLFGRKNYFEKRLIESFDCKEVTKKFLS
jgi:hypothetical protein